MKNSFSFSVINSTIFIPSYNQIKPLSKPMAKCEHFLFRANFDIPILVEVDMNLSRNKERPE